MKLKFTRITTQKSVYETTINMPTADLAAIEAWAKIAMHPDADYQVRGTFHPHWRDEGPETHEISVVIEPDTASYETRRVPLSAPQK